MFIEERHAAILDILAENGSVTTAELQARFGISYDSAKRDLRLLEEAGKLRRTHGGAIPVGTLNTSALRRSAEPDVPADECARIAQYAVSLIKEDELIFLPSGRMGEMIAEKLPRALSVRVVTGSLTVAQMLRRREGVTVILVGGEVDGDGNCHDSFAVDMLKRFRFDKAFLESDAVSADFGASVRDTDSVAYLAAVTDGAKRVIGLYPSAKVGTAASVSVCRARELDAIITCGDVADDVRRALDGCGVSVVVCE